MKTGRIHPVRAFSMIELIVVMIIIGLLSAIVVPRLIGTQARQAEVDAQSLRALLSAAAQQDALSSTPVALAYDHEKNELSVELLREELTAIGASPTPGSAERKWLPAQMIRPVRLTALKITAADADGQAQAAETPWRIEFPQARPRPVVSLLVQTAPGVVGDKRAWQIDLLPGRTAATMHSMAVDAPITQAVNSAQDLDDEGRRTEPW